MEKAMRFVLHGITGVRPAGFAGMLSNAPDFSGSYLKATWK